MKKTAIANWGHSSQGKSGTLKKLIELILATYPLATTNPTTISYAGDVTVIITLGNIKIGIETVGDPNSHLWKSLKTFVSAHCDIIVCSTRTSGSTVDLVDDLHNSNNYDIIWATNYRSNEKNRERLNTLSAKQFLELIEMLMLVKIL